MKKYFISFIGLTFMVIMLTSSTIIGYCKSDSVDKCDSIKTLLVGEVNKYIKSIAPTSRLSGEKLVDLCVEYNIDISFVLAQGQIESHYGTRGTAAKTHSVFNVGAYNGYSASRQRSNGFGFSHPNESIEPFLILLRKNYLVKGKTVNDLMFLYVNHMGMRYASDGRYEGMLRSVYNKINNKTNIDNLYLEYIKLLND